VVLRASGQKDGEEFDLNNVIGTGDGDVGVAHGNLLVKFSDAVFADDAAAMDRYRATLIEELGEEALIDAAGTVASFNAVVRVADGTGIPLDEFKQDPAREIMNELDLEDFSSGPRV